MVCLSPKSNFPKECDRFPLFWFHFLLLPSALPAFFFFFFFCGWKAFKCIPWIEEYTLRERHLIRTDQKLAISVEFC